MRAIVAFAAALLACLPARALDAPTSIADARLELRAGTTPGAALAEAARGKGATWVGWSVPVVAEAGDMCCFSVSFERRACSLATREKGWGASDGPGKRSFADMYVLVGMQDGAVNRVRIVSPGCPVEGGQRRLLWLGPVDSGASLAALGRILESAEDDEVSHPSLAAIAYHGDAQADAILERRIFDRSLPSEAREQAVFWTGHVRGESGARLLDRLLSSEPSGDLRQNAVFALSQSSVPDAPERIKRVAVEDRDPEVRGHALFSLSQTHDPAAGQWILGRLDAEEDPQVREQVLFALSQLDDGTDWLLKVLRSKRDKETIRQALFWLAQSDDERALQEIEKILR